MCLLSVYSPGALVNVEHLEEGAICNPHGYGYAIIVGDRIEIAHGMEPYAVIDAFERARLLHPESWALFHSRYTTDGSTTVDNCHPFIVGGDPRTVLAHNGILPVHPSKGDLRSDTRILAEDLIPSGRFGKMWRPRAQRKLTEWMLRERYPNKVAILTVDPRYKRNAIILNDDAGEWVNGVWHSNDGYKPSPYTYTSRRDWDEMRDNHDDNVARAFTRYSNGEMSYSEYLNVLYTGKNPANCDWCAGKGTVNTTYGYCTACKSCTDCWAHLDACDCWAPGDMDTVRRALDVGPPMALDTSYSAVVRARSEERGDESDGRELC